MANQLNANVLNVGAVNYVSQWSFDATTTLIRRRRHYQQRFSTASYNDYRNIWSTIARDIQRIDNFTVKGSQCKNKWNKLVRGYVNLKRIRSGNPHRFPIESPNSYDERFFGELSDEFWEVYRSNYLFI